MADENGIVIDPKIPSLVGHFEDKFPRVAFSQSWSKPLMIGASCWQCRTVRGGLREGCRLSLCILFLKGFHYRGFTHALRHYKFKTREGEGYSDWN